MIKQVLVYRRDLKMRKGKIAAQCAHASMKVFFDRGCINENRSTRTVPNPCGYSIVKESNPSLSIPLTPEMREWVEGIFTKIVLTVESEEDLLRALELARAAHIPCALITDVGKTEFNGVATNTAIAIGPAKAEEIDKITGPEGAVKTRLP